MENFKHSLAIAALPGAACAALSSVAGLRAWWTDDCTGDALPGARSTFVSVALRRRCGSQARSKDSDMRWVCTGAFIDVPSLGRKEEWTGTEMIFRLSATGAGKTRLDFEHIGVCPALECYAMCARGWRHFLGSLQHYLETGAGMPYRTTVQRKEGSVTA